MRLKAVLFFTITLFLLMGNIGCEQDSNVYYQGKVISLNNGSGCYNLILITKSIPHGLSVNSTIAFDTQLYNGQIKVGDVVFFKFKNFVEWTGDLTMVCTAPQYVGQLEFKQ